MMKIKMFCGALALALSFSSCDQNSNEGYSIEGQLNGLTEGTSLELLPGATHKNEKPIAISKIGADGTFSFKGSVPTPRMFYLHVADSRGVCKLVIGSGQVKVEGTVTVENNQDAKFYDFSKVTVTGSAVNDEYLKKIAPHAALDTVYANYHKKYEAVNKAMQEARQAENKTAYDSIAASPSGQAFRHAEKAFFDSVTSISNGIILDNKDSWWGPFLMMDIMNYLTKSEIAIYDKFSPDAKESYYGKLVKEELFPEGFIGKKAPDFVVVDDQGKELRSSALMKGKKYILVDFWASWCHPCRKEIPNLKNLYGKYASKGLQIISISIDKKEADWRKAMDEEKLPWLSFLDKKNVAELYKVKLIPAIFLINDQGVVVSDKLRGEELAAKLEELFR
ncbi:TlpA disulfide reductase family protein [uncultured Bacteroides sp.]|uniref:TlpA disulfide reductase family protein n=1 Tax=uncultured Bacteroides sp. TaxID=162156 RepID=UPI002AAAE48C|nr:TlpA disulfide reductase family protein [uncultured Bacteroides sp.]